MKRLSIRCLTCGKGWQVGLAVSLYEQQAVESRPCPRCGAYTLCCTERTLTRQQARKEPAVLVGSSG